MPVPVSGLGLGGALAQLGVQPWQPEEWQVPENHAMFSTIITITFLSAAANAVGAARFCKATQLILQEP